MTRKSYTMLPVLAAIVMIPQLLFWWLAPVTADARLAVYIGGTVLTVGIPAAYLATYWNSSLRKAAGLSVVCCVLEIAVAALAALLLGLDASVRSAVFALIIAALICVAVLVPLISAALRQQRQGVYTAAIPAQPDTQPVHDLHSDGPRPCQSVPLRMPQQTSAGKPLPPRKR